MISQGQAPTLSSEAAWTKPGKTCLWDKKATQVKTATADIREQSRQAGKISNLSLEQASWTTRYQAQRKSRENSATPSGYWTELS